MESPSCSKECSCASLWGLHSIRPSWERLFLQLFCQAGTRRTQQRQGVGACFLICSPFALQFNPNKEGRAETLV